VWLCASVFVQLECALLVRFAHYTSAHHSMYFPPCGTLKTSSLNFFYLSSSFWFYLIYMSPFLLSPRFQTPSALPYISLTLFMSFLKLENKSWRISFTPRPIVILRHCSVLPEKQYKRIILYTVNVWAYIRTISLKLIRTQQYCINNVYNNGLYVCHVIWMM